MDSNFSEIHENQTIDLNPSASYSGQGVGKGPASINSLENDKNSPKLITLN